MRITHISRCLSYGGAQSMLASLANCQAARGHQVDLVLIGDAPAEEPLLVELQPHIGMHRIAAAPAPLMAIRTTRLLHKLKPEAIHLHGTRFYTLLLTPSLQRIATATVHHIPSGPLYSTLGRILPAADLNLDSNAVAAHRVPRLCAVSRAVQNELRKVYGLDSRVVENGLPTRRFTRRQRSRGPASPMRLLQTGGLDGYRKGNDLLVKAVAALGGKAHLTFVGSGPSLEPLKSLVEALHAGEWVEFAGNKPHKWIAQNLARYDALVNPSRIEGFGLTVAEALAAGLPVIVARGSTAAEVTQNDRYGWTVPPDNAEALTQMIAHVAANYDQAMQKSETALAHVRAHYDVSIPAALYLTIYNSVPTRPL